MKLTLLALFLAFTGINSLFSQIKVNEISANNKTVFLTTVLNYPITGTYLFEGKTEPIAQLNPNGTGIFQLHENKPKNMTWGIECSNIGIPRLKEGFNSVVYNLWYKNDGEENWNEVQFSIHFSKRKMFISGERVKEYTEEEFEAFDANKNHKTR